MNHNNYVGKELKELIYDINEYAIGFYYVSRYGELRDLLKDEKKKEMYLNRKIQTIEGEGYSFNIVLEPIRIYERGVSYVI